MLISSWLETFRRHASRRRVRTTSRRSNRHDSCDSARQVEKLEERALLTTLFIEEANAGDFTTAGQGIAITNAEYAGFDSIAIESVILDGTTGSGIHIDLDNVTLNSLAIESVVVTNPGLSAINIDLTNVAGLRTISIEDIVASGTGVGINIALAANTDVHAITIDDSTFPGVSISATGDSNITHGSIANNFIAAREGVDGILLDLDASVADDFRIMGNNEISSLTNDSVKVKIDNAPRATDGLTIEDNNFGAAAPVSVDFVVDGDTVNQPFTITNTSNINQNLQQIVLDVSPAFLVFDEDPITGTPFTPTLPFTPNPTGFLGHTIDPTNSTLTLDFNDFQPGETFQWNVDLDHITGTPQTVLGNDLIGSTVALEFLENTTLRTISGVMVGHETLADASRFVTGLGTSGANGITLDLTGAPLTNLLIDNNVINGTPGHNVHFLADANSDITGVVSNNQLLSSGMNGLFFELTDSNFSGAILDNNISNHQQNGIRFSPSVSRSGVVEFANDTSPIIITSTNHGLDTGDAIILQGLVDDDIKFTHPGNTPPDVPATVITRIDNDRFSLDNTPRTMNTVTNVSSAGPVIITAPGHGLRSGRRVLIEGVAGNTAANGVHRITVIDDDTFELNGVNANGAWLGGGLWARMGVYAGGGTWYEPQEQPDGSLRGLVTLDFQTQVPGGFVENASNTTPIVITSRGHGLTSGDRVSISEVNGNFAANGLHKVTVIDADSFTLDGSTGSGTYDPSERLGRWTKNVITAISDTSTGDPIIITAPNHGLVSGDRVRISDANYEVEITPGFGQLLPTAANGTFEIIVLDADTFRLPDGVFDISDGPYTGVGGVFTPLRDDTFHGDQIPQLISGNTLTANGDRGVHVELTTGTVFNADVVRNQVADNRGFGFEVSSKSFGAGLALPLDPRDLTAVPIDADISFDVNIGSQNVDDGNIFDGNFGAGVLVQALNAGTGSYRISNNTFLRQRDDPNSTIFNGDGIHIRLEGDLPTAEATSLLATSIIEDNALGLDRVGNEGPGIAFSMEERTRIESLQVVGNLVVNNNDDGFTFDRRDDASLNGVIVDKNTFSGNAGDGLDFFAQNTSRDPLDFTFTNNNITNNAFYGIRTELVADARVKLVMNDNFVDQNGTLGGGFHPDTLDGAAGMSGGIGILGFQQVDLVIDMNDNRVSDNIGDGFAIDAFNFFDTMSVVGDWRRNQFVGNTLSGFRNYGASFGRFNWVDNRFDGNEEDGARSVSVDDKNDFFDRRVGGNDIDITATGNSFSNNGANGLHLGQGVNAQIGDGTFPNQNVFNENDEDGLKVTQGNGFYLFERGRRRHITAEFNEFNTNGDDGIDLGEFALTEGGNVEHGDEVITNTHVVLNNITVGNNLGDGIEYLADNVPRILPVVGGGQDDLDVFLEANSSLTVIDSRISRNEGRGIDILNRAGETSRVNIFNSDVQSNGLSGVYVVNTASHWQEQNGPEDVLNLSQDTTGALPQLIPIQRIDSNETLDARPWDLEPNLEIRIQDNSIESNGDATRQSTVPINESNDPGDPGARSPDWRHNSEFVNGTLGGVVFRVGTADATYDPFFFPDIVNSNVNDDTDIWQAGPELELGHAGIDAEVFRNTLNGNIGAEFYVDSFISVLPRPSAGNHDSDNNPPFGNPDFPTVFDRDPLARLDLVFRANTSDENDQGVRGSLDVTNGFAFLDNHEPIFKSRIGGAPNDVPGPHNFSGRQRNATRTLGFAFGATIDDPVGTVPTNQLFCPPYPIPEAPPGVVDFCLVPHPGPAGAWAYDGEGTPTFRVESDFEFNNFERTDRTLGFSDFFDEINLGNGTFFGELDYQWDTGVDTANFIGRTPYSLDRGDVFDVQAGENPLRPDIFEENDSFIAAFDLGALDDNAPLDLVQRARALSGDSNALVNIEYKGDRDYYSFVPELIGTQTGQVNVTLDALDAGGDTLFLMVYEINEEIDTEEIPLRTQADGLTPDPIIVAAGASGLFPVDVTAGNRYIIEILSQETQNHSDELGFVAGGKTFVYGTTRSYNMTMVLTPGVPAPSVAPDTAAPDTSNGGGTLVPVLPETSGGVKVALPGPPSADVVDVTPDPRDTAAGNVAIQFSEDVTGVDIEDFRLTRDGINVPLDGLTVTQSTFPDGSPDPSRYTVDLSTVTGRDGTYVLTLVAQNSEIADTTATLLLNDASDTWEVVSTVDSTLDTPDTFPGDGQFSDANGNKTLRAAVMEANASPGDDFIRLGGGIFAFTRAGNFEDEALFGDLDITDNLTIIGQGAGATIIDASDLDRVFHIHRDITLTLQSVTVRGGEAVNGGGILLENGATLNLFDSNLVQNEAFNQGGGLFINNPGNLHAERSSISMNVAGSRGGGMFTFGTADVFNTTFSGNTAVSRGGAIYNAGSTELTNVTISDNFAGSRGGGLSGESGLLVRTGNSIIAGNRADSRNPDVDGTLRSNGFNLIGIVDGDTDEDGQLSNDELAAAGLVFNEDLFGTPTQPLDAGLTVLVNAGGNDTYRHNLQEGSAAIDAGSLTLIQDPLFVEMYDTTRDQLRRVRVIDGDEDSVQNIDIGSVERFINRPVAFFSASPNPAARNEDVTFDGRQSTHSNAPNRRLVLFEWDFEYDGNPNHFNTAAATVDPAGDNDALLFTARAEGVGGNSITVEYRADGGANSPLNVTVNGNDIIVNLAINGALNITSTAAEIKAAIEASAAANALVEVEHAGTDNGTGVVTAMPVTNLAGANAVTTGAVLVRDFSDPRFANVTRTEVALRVTDDSTPAQTDVFSVTMSFGAPPTPVITRPVDHDENDGLPAVTSDLTPTIVWTDIEATFELEVFDVTPGSGNPRIIHEQNVATNSFTTGRLSPGNYRARVRAFNSEGNSAFSAFYDFDVVQIAMVAPGGRIFDATPLFEWTGVAGASRYELWVNAIRPKFQSQVISLTSLPGDSTTYEQLSRLPISEYKVWVRAFDALDQPGHWSPAQEFEVVRPTISEPPTPTIDRTPTIAWDDLGAAAYDLWVNRQGGPSQIIRQIVFDTSFTPATAVPNGTYHAWVRAIDDMGETGIWSRRYTFRVDLRHQTTFISPGPVTVDRTPEISWEVIHGAVRYDLWVDDLTRGRRMVIREQNLTAPTFTPTENLLPGSYRAWVRAFNEDGEPSAWSAPHDFLAPVPLVTGPVPPIDTRMPTITWIGVNEFVRYDLWVNNVTTGQAQIIREQNLTDTQFTPTFDLGNGIFRVWVRGFDAQGFASVWSDPFEFTINVVQNDAPILIGPSGTTGNNTPQFSWQPQPNAATYEILIKSLDDPTQPTVFQQNGIAGTTFDLPTALSPGRYRWWVRGFNTQNEVGAFSAPLDFRVVSTAAPATRDGKDPEVDTADGPVDGDVMIAAVTSEVSVSPLTAVDDSRRSTTKPAGQEPVRVTTPPDPSDGSHPHENIDQIVASRNLDAVMSEWPDLEWWQAPTVTANESDQTDDVVALAETSADSQPVELNAATAALALPHLAARKLAARKKKKRRQSGDQR